jgi:hypothetical protein
VCGLSLARQPLPRPLLFQASALREGGPVREERQTISAPALGRVEPMPIQEREDLPPVPAPHAPSMALDEPAAPSETGGAFTDSFWPVVKMEGMEFTLLMGLNGALALIASWTAGGSPSSVYGHFWTFLVPLHAAISWAFVMVPLVLVGQSPMMGRQRLLLDTDLPERRMSFSLLHLVSTLCFPLSFLCMVLTPSHRTLAELLSGLEILQLPSSRLR